MTTPVRMSLITGVDSGFEYALLDKAFTVEGLTIHGQRIRRHFADTTKRWTASLHGEWMTRHYLAVKLIVAATVLLTSQKYADRRNIAVTRPYSYYYAALCAARALLLTAPLVDWRNGEIMQSTHSKIRKITVDFCRHLDKPSGDRIDRFFRTAKAFRELFSYRFPGTGLRAINGVIAIDAEETEWACRFLCDLAQFNSECMQAAYAKNVEGEYVPDGESIEMCFLYKDDDLEVESGIWDDEDSYRIGYAIRKQRQPVNLLATATEGLVEDAFGAWVDSDETCDEGSYDPDGDWQLLFDFR